MTAKHPVAYPSEFNDATEAIANQISHATEALAAHLSQATEIIRTQHLSNLRMRAIRSVPNHPVSRGLPDETWQGWSARLMPSLVITLWFCLVFAILAATAPATPAVKTSRQAAVGSAPAISIQPPVSMNAEEYSLRDLTTDGAAK